MKAHIIDMPVLRPGDIVRGLGIDLALKDDFTAINGEEVKKDESASVRNASKEDKS